MARTYASVNVTIWNDDDFRALSPAGQHLYFVLLTDPGLSYCGVGDWLPKRIVQKAAGWDMADFLAAAMELVSDRLIVIAEDTDEFLVRSFIRYDGVMTHPRLCVSAAIAVAEVGSNALRQVIVGELKRLKKDRPDLPSWGRDQVADVLKRKALDGREIDPFLEPFSPGLREAFSQGFSQNASSGLGTPYTSTNTITPTPRGESSTSTSPERADKTPAPIQRCGKSHPDEKACHACGVARANEEAEAKARRREAEAARRAEQRAREQADIEDITPATADQIAAAKAKVSAANPPRQIASKP